MNNSLSLSLLYRRAIPFTPPPVSCCFPAIEKETDQASLALYIPRIAVAVGYDKLTVP